MKGILISMVLVLALAIPAAAQESNAEEIGFARAHLVGTLSMLPGDGDVLYVVNIPARRNEPPFSVPLLITGESHLKLVTWALLNRRSLSIRGTLVNAQVTVFQGANRQTANRLFVKVASVEKVRK
jgi:hypothetical protein